MKRNCSLLDISDGRLYNINDLANLSCNGCKGEASCCHGMGNSIILDPFDIYRITTKLQVTFEQLLSDKIVLNVVDGVILPNLRMTDAREGCSFLNEKGRCSIHSDRPGICRIFPLGRYYENNSFQYFLQKNECKNTSKTMAKVGKWIDTVNLEENKQFLIDWHYFLNEVEGIIKNSKDAEKIKNINLFILHHFYLKSYNGNENFYIQFHNRLKESKSALKMND